MIHLSLAFQSLLVSQTYWYVGFQQCRRDTEVKTHCPTPKTLYLKCSHGIKPTMLFCVKETSTQTYYCCFFMAQIMETMRFFFFHMIMFLFAMQAHYSTASILAYITQSNKVIQKTEQVHVRLATRSARLTSTAGFTVSEYIQKDYYCRYHTK